MSQKRALENKTREYRMLQISKFGRSVILLLATVLSFTAIGLLVTDNLLRPDGFVISEFKLTGDFQNINAEQVKKVVKQESTGNFFSVDLLKVKQTVEMLPWVRNAEIRRQWPNTLLVHLDEHKPVMKWQKKQWVNSYGQVISLPEEIKLTHAIHLSGDVKNSKMILQQAFAWKKRLSKYHLQIVDVALSTSNSWRLRLQDQYNNEFDLLLGKQQVEQRLQRFLFVYQNQFMQAGTALDHVDARYPDGLAIKTNQVKSDLASQS